MDRAIALLADRQWGLVALAQLIALGLTASAVRHRVGAGKLHRVHYGVYAVGHSRLSKKGHFMAAVLACGPGAVLSHRSAADLLGLRTTARASVDVTAPRRCGKSRPGIDVHRATSLTPADVTRLDGIPTTTVARTLLDLAEVLPRRAVARAFDRAEQLRALDLLALDDVLRRAGGRRGAHGLRAVVGGYRIADSRTRNELERTLLAICRHADLPEPRVNFWIPLDDGEGPGAEGDFVWPDRRLVVEADGHETHGTRLGTERDHVRDRRLRRADWRVERFTWRQVFEEPAAVSAALRELLATPPPAARRSAPAAARARRAARPVAS